MIVIGGIYQEKCLTHNWDYIFGSAGRAAAILAGPLNTPVRLHGFCNNESIDSFKASLAAYKVEMELLPTSDKYVFEYFHPLSDPRIGPRGGELWPPSATIEDRSILLFGAFEGYPKIRAKRLVIDPQGERLRDFFSPHRIEAEEMVIVANEDELGSSGHSPESAIRRTFLLNDSIVGIIVKRGVLGATVFNRSSKKSADIAPYASSSVFKIGSGDAFSAGFFREWTRRPHNLKAAADFGSRVAACYVEDPSLNFAESTVLKKKALPIGRRQTTVYLAGPFFSLSDVMLLAEARRAVAKLGVRTFSPLHHVGVGKNDLETARKDLAGLRRCRSVLALVEHQDAGTIFEIGYARAFDIPAVVYTSGNLRPLDRTMFSGTHCKIETDFCTAIYKAAWAGLH